MNIETSKHIRLIKIKVKYIDILLHSLNADGLWYYWYSLLH